MGYVMKIVHNVWYVAEKMRRTTHYAKIINPH